jgi:beta-galactosidase/beta-glucuronidase
VQAEINGLISPGGLKFAKTVDLAAGETKAVLIDGLSIVKPELWWPVTYGKQFLYTTEAKVSVKNTVSDSRVFKFGVRKFTYPVDGNMLTLFCNGTRIVCKGGNWGLDDGLLTDTPEIYDHKVRLHAEENCTMIRNWVGMTGHSAFYDACDKYGVLIWDDFWLANPVDGPNPNDNALFLENAVDKISRFRSHPALAFYCGRNESSPPEILDAGLKERVDSYDGTRFYFPNSAGPPVGSGGGYSLAAPGGAYGVKQYFNDVNSAVLRSERGIPNVPNIESLRRFIAPENLWPISESWALHDWTYHMNGPANTYMQALKTYIDGDFTIPVDKVSGQDPSEADPVFKAYKADILKMTADAGKAYTLEDFGRMAMMINFENHRGMFEALAARRSNGLLMWMSQSSWPSLMWQTYDWYLDANSGYFGTKAGNQSTHAIWDPRDDSIILHNASGRSYKNVSVTAAVFDLRGVKASERVFTVEALAPDAYGVVLGTADFSASSTDVVFLRLTLKDADGKILGDNYYWHNRKTYQDYRALSTLPKVELTGSVKPDAPLGDSSRYTLTVTNTTDVPAVLTRIRTVRAKSGEDVLPVFYTDNYFTLMPGESKTLNAEFKTAYLEGESPRFLLSGWNTAAKAL